MAEAGKSYSAHCQYYDSRCRCNHRQHIAHRVVLPARVLLGTGVSDHRLQLLARDGIEDGRLGWQQGQSCIGSRG